MTFLQLDTGGTLDLIDKHGLALVMLVIFLGVLITGGRYIFLKLIKEYKFEKDYNRQRDEDDLTTIIKMSLFVDETKNRIESLENEVRELRKEAEKHKNELLSEIIKSRQNNQN